MSNRAIFQDANILTRAVLRKSTFAPILSQINRGALRRSDLAQQIGVAIQYLEQLDQGQRRFGLAVLVARKRIHATAKNIGSFTLV
jgi:hypothetical protein